VDGELLNSRAFLGFCDLARIIACAIWPSCLVHLLATVARLAGPGGARSVVPESALVKHQLVILNRTGVRSPSPPMARKPASEGTAVNNAVSNRRLAYVAISRGRYDAQIYTNDKAQLAVALDRDVSHRAAIEVTRTPAAAAQTIERSPRRRHRLRNVIRRRRPSPFNQSTVLDGIKGSLAGSAARPALDAVCAPCWSNRLDVFERRSRMRLRTGSQRGLGSVVQSWGPVG
jgi:hypothetical protein